MKRVIVVFFLFVSSLSFAQEYKMWYQNPAGKVWEKALPLGNGFIGGMVYGNTEEERIDLNETSFWSGGPYATSPTLNRDSLEKLRSLVFSEKYKEAENMANRVLFSHGSHGQMFLPIGSLILKFPGQKEATSYYRELDLSKAVASTRFSVGKQNYEREVFTPLQEKVLVMKLSSTEAMNVEVLYRTPLPEGRVVQVQGNELQIGGRNIAHEGSEGALRFHGIIHVKQSGGNSSRTDSSLIISNAKELVLYVSLATNYQSYQDVSGDEKALARARLTSALKSPYAELKRKHIEKYQSLYNRVELTLGSDRREPTDIRLEKFREGNDPGFAALYFQFGRYLLISSSQPGGQPANLQGIWNASIRPPWDSKYTININTEMNYWPAERTNLSEMHKPLFEMVKDLTKTGAVTAKRLYGAGGWVAHHNTDLWRLTWPVDAAFYGLWPSGGAWLSQHIWEHYQYTGNLDFLKENQEVLFGAARFYADILQKHPKYPYLVINPSTSPENAPEAHQRSSLSAGVTMDNQLAFDVFQNAIWASKILGVETQFSDSLKQLLKQLPPMHIGKYGQLQEWLDDVDSPQDKHRHVSHLYGLFPSSQISPYRHPALFSAARTTLEHRGDVSTGWSMGWKVNWWARLKDGDHAYLLIENQLTPLGKNKDGGGTYPNLFDAHPPFQIDGNFGCTAGIAEMLVQSADGAVEVLPALPSRWAEGKVKGLKCLGGFEIEELVWEKGQLKRLVVKSHLGGNLRLRLPRAWTKGVEAKGENPNPFFFVPEIGEPVVSSEAQIHLPQIRSTYLYDLKTEKGRRYVIE